MIERDAFACERGDVFGQTRRDGRFTMPVRDEQKAAHQALASSGRSAKFSIALRPPAAWRNSVRET